MKAKVFDDLYTNIGEAANSGVEMDQPGGSSSIIIIAGNEKDGAWLNYYENLDQAFRDLVDDIDLNVEDDDIGLLDLVRDYVCDEGDSFALFVCADFVDSEETVRVASAWWAKKTEIPIKE